MKGVDKDDETADDGLPACLPACLPASQSVASLHLFVNLYQHNFIENQEITIFQGAGGLCL